MRLKMRANWVNLKYTTLNHFIKLLFLFCFLNNTKGFNIDTKRPQIHRRPNTGFGYSVDFVYRTQKQDKFTYGLFISLQIKKKICFRLLVGAPFAQSSQRGLRNAGAVYGCEINQNTCAEIFFDRKQGN